MMIINKDNADLINTATVYLHDDILSILSFDRQKYELQLSIDKEFGDSSYIVTFSDVIGFKMTSCDFWGRSPHILDFNSLKKEDVVLLPELYALAKENISPRCKAIENSDDYFETMMTFSSGDTLRIVCRYIQFPNTQSEN